MTKITITKVEEVDKKFVEKMLDSKFCLNEKREGLRDWFWRNSEMNRDDEKGDVWKIKKQKFNEFMNLIKAQDEELIKILKEDIDNKTSNVDNELSKFEILHKIKKEFKKLVDKLGGDLNDN